MHKDLQGFIEALPKTLPRFDEGAGEAELMALERQSNRQLQTKDVAEMTQAIISDRGLLLLDGGNILVGKQEQRDFFEDILALDGLEFEFEPISAQVSASNDMGWVYGAYRLKMPGGEPDLGKYVSVWVREDGTWMNMAEIRNSSIARF